MKPGRLFRVWFGGEKPEVEGYIVAADEKELKVFCAKRYLNKLVKWEDKGKFNGSKK